MPVERGAVKQETPSVIHQEREGARRAYDKMSLECSEKAFYVVRTASPAPCLLSFFRVSFCHPHPVCVCVPDITVMVDCS